MKVAGVAAANGVSEEVKNSGYGEVVDCLYSIKLCGDGMHVSESGSRGYSTHPLLVVVGLASSSEEGGVVTGTARTEAAGRRRMATAKAAAASHHTNRRVVNIRQGGCCTHVETWHELPGLRPWMGGAADRPAAPFFSRCSAKYALSTSTSSSSSSSSASDGRGLLLRPHSVSSSRSTLARHTIGLSQADIHVSSLLATKPKLDHPRLVLAS